MRRPGKALPALALGLILLAGCTQAPPPAPVVSSTPATPTVTPKVDLKQAVVGVDTVAGGYNPHQIADQSTVTTALASMMLPSVFHSTADGVLRLDRSVMLAAKVTSAAPFTVTYTLRKDAAWSDGVPIRAEDFSYLHDEMSSQTGVVDPAGYRLISGISARQGGTVAVVRFSKPYPEWRSLFTDLLPAHLLKDAPGGWAGALATGYPASGGPFALRSVDPVRGEIVLQRNDRYWAKPSVLDGITLLGSDPSGLARSLREGGDQLASVADSSTSAAALQALRGHGVAVRSVPRAAVAQVILRSPELLLRKAIAAAIDRAALIRLGTGNAHKPLVDNSLLRAPSQTGYTATMPRDAPGARPDPGRVPTLLRQAGYRGSAGSWHKSGRALHIVVAAAANAQPYASIAGALVDQLTAAGLPATLATPSATTLYGTDLALRPGAATKRGSGGESTGTPSPATTAATGGTPTTTAADAPVAIDVLVGPGALDSSPATTLASRFGCPSRVAGSGTAPTATVSNFCDPALNARITAALDGSLPFTAAARSLEPKLWSQAVILPLFQLRDLVAVRHDMHGVSGSPPLVTPFAGAALWRRSAR